jgi:tetratricopeptide (TPR) repeat protein
LLLEGRRSTDRDITVLITMRSDFIGECADFPGLSEAVSATQYLVPALDRSQIESIIVAPITKAGAEIEPRLVQQLLTDVEGEPDQLPVLQHCLLQLWRRAGVVAAGKAEGGDVKADPGASSHGAGRYVDSDCYEKIGKISKALNLHAERILPEFHEKAVEAVFRALSELKDGKAIRRMLPFGRLAAECGVADEELQKIVNRFRSDDCSFLVTSPAGAEKIRNNTVIYVGHEALLRRWERISGAPGATGESRDERPIGWLREERRDGQRYQSLLMMLVDNGGSGKVEDIDRQLKWWNERVRTEQWAERYGGRLTDVKALLESALRERRIQRWRYAGLSVIVAALLGVVVMQSWRQRQQVLATAESNRLAQENFARAEENFVQSVNIVKGFLNDINYALNHGNMKLAAAEQMKRTADKAVEDLKARMKAGVTSDNAKALTVDFDNVSADILSMTKPDEEPALVQEAETLARQLVEVQPENDEWQNLLFQSKFRRGDDLGNENKAGEALKEYQQAEGIIHRLADKYPANGEHLYYLAFITSKIGTAYKDDGRYKEALDQFRAALGFARQLAADHPDSPEWQAAVPSTMSKIAAALVGSPQPDLMAALHQYDAAMTYQRSLLTAFPADFVIKSNFASTLRSRAAVLAAIGQWGEAEAQFDDAIRRREDLLASDMNNVTPLTYLATDYRTFAQALLNRAGLGVAAVSRLTPEQRRLLAKAREVADKEIAVRQRLVDIQPAKKGLVKDLTRAKNECDQINVQLDDAKPDGHCLGETLAVRLFGLPDAAQLLESRPD